MAWRRVNPRLVKQDQPAERRVWYWDDGSLDTGELVLWLDWAGRVARFQLAHARFLVGREYLAEWQRGTGLRLGEVQDGERVGRAGMAPLVRYGVTDPRVLATLGDYFARNAAVLPPLHRAAVAAALDTAPAPGPLPSMERPPRPLGDAVGGRAGGTGDGTAATHKVAPRGA